MLLHGGIGVGLVLGWAWWSSPPDVREVPKFEVQLTDNVNVQEEIPLAPEIEPPTDPEPEVIPAVVVEAPPLHEPEPPEVVELQEYDAPRPWIPRHLRTRPTMAPEPVEAPIEPVKPAPVVAPPPVSVVMAPAIDNAQCPPPTYPRRAQRLRWHGLTMLLVDVDAKGNPIRITVRTSSGYDILDEAAIEAVEKWHFHPATRNGVAEGGKLLVPIRFEAPK